MDVYRTPIWVWTKRKFFLFSSFAINIKSLVNIHFYPYQNRLFFVISLSAKSTHLIKIVCCVYIYFDDKMNERENAPAITNQLAWEKWRKVKTVNEMGEMNDYLQRIQLVYTHIDTRIHLLKVKYAYTHMCPQPMVQFVFVDPKSNWAQTIKTRMNKRAI